MVWWLLKKFNIELLYDPAIPHLGMYPKEEEKERTEKIFEEIIIENFPNMVKEIDRKSVV